MIKYSIKKNNNIWILWKEIHKGKGYACKGIYQGTKEKCQEYLKKIKEKR